MYGSSLVESGFSQRAMAYLTAARDAAKTWYDAEGYWLPDSKPAETRERFWLSFAPYALGDAAFADAIIRRGQTQRYGDQHFNIFDTNIATALLVTHREQMAPDVRKKLEGLVCDGFSFKPGNRQPDYQFHGYNDNMPAKATMGLVLGGELLGNSDAVEYGLWNLRQFRAMLVRRGINSEFNSPTYSPLTIHAMSEIAEHAQHEEARQLALGIEQRLWIDVASRFHPEMGVLAGPYARAYTIDTIAHASSISGVLWFLLGDRVHPSPMELFQRPEGLVVHHKGDYPFNITGLCWYACGNYHLPELAMELFTRKSTPFTSVASCEQGAAGPDFPARPCRIETVLYPDFTIGTSSTSLCGGEQTMSYFVTYRRKKAVTSFRDIGTVYAKMVVNDDGPGEISHAIEMPDAGAEWVSEQQADPVVYSNFGEEDNFASRANTITLQEQATALVLTHPHLSLAEETGGKPLSALSELVVFASHFGGADEIIVGGTPRAEWSGMAKRGEWIACRRGRLLIAVRPMGYTRTSGPAELTLEKVNNYEVIRATFYRGEERRFTREELAFTFGGFVAEHASVDEYPSLAAFADACANAKFTDYFWSTRRIRYRRPENAARQSLELEVSWSPGSQQPRIAAINGREVDMPTVHIDGVDPATLPFLSEPFQSVPSFFPWKDFTVEWGDWPYAIGDRED